MKKKSLQREGFWREGKKSHLPFPVMQPFPWKGKAAFLEALSAVEHAEQTREEHYKGYSTCRICGIMNNGDSTFIVGNWTWPSGFSHYVREHNVRPSLAFEEFIVGREIQ